jgi:integrase
VHVDLSESTRDRLRRSARDSTRAAYRGDLRRFLDWCTTHRLIQPGLMPDPTTPLREVDETRMAAAFGAVIGRVDSFDALALEYVNDLMDTGKAPSTVDRALAALAVAYRSTGSGRLNTEPARAALKTYRRDRAEAGGRVRKASATTVKVIRQMVATLDTDTPIGIRDRAILILGFAMGARRSELASLDLADLTESEEGFEVLVRFSKTDKDSVGRTVAIPYGTDPHTCPVRTLKAWLALLRASGHTGGPLFVRIDRHGRLGRCSTGRGSPDGRITGQAVAIVVHRAGTRAGIGSDKVWSGHSLRRGFATEARRAGHDGIQISRHGGWVDGSRALAGYFERADQWTENPLRGIGL